MKVYVGTHGKYNNGSVAGAWLDLDDYKDYKEFLIAATKLHADESDPELMIQDCETGGEDWEDAFTGEETSDYADYWKVKAEVNSNGGKLREPIATVTRNERKNGIEIKFYKRPNADILSGLKAHGWRWSRFGGLWYTKFSDAAQDYAQKIANSETVGSSEDNAHNATRHDGIFFELEKTCRNSLKEYREWLESDERRIASLWKRDVNGHIKELAAAVRLDDGEWITIEKGHITTEHCEGEDDGRGRSMEDAQAGCSWFRTEAGFKISNNHKSSINGPRTQTYGPNAFSWKRETWRIHSENGRTEIYRRDCEWMKDAHGMREVSEGEWRRLRAAYAWRAINLRRRVNSYWRRFGNTKLHTWTYWTEA